MKLLIPFFGLSYLVVCMVQMLAIADGLAHALHTPLLLGLPLALFLTWLPVIGPAFGTYGAAMSWGWSWLGAALFFVSPLLTLPLTVALTFVIDGTAKRHQASVPEAAE